MLTNAPKGTKDMMPDQAYKWHYIEEAFAEICRVYGFQEIRTPMFEHTESCFSEVLETLRTSYRRKCIHFRITANAI